MFKVMIHPADYDNVRNAVDSAFETLSHSGDRQGKC